MRPRPIRPRRAAQHLVILWPVRLPARPALAKAHRLRVAVRLVPHHAQADVVPGTRRLTYRRGGLVPDHLRRRRRAAVAVPRHAPPVRVIVRELVVLLRVGLALAVSCPRPYWRREGMPAGPAARGRPARPATRAATCARQDGARARRPCCWPAPPPGSRGARAAARGPRQGHHQARSATTAARRRAEPQRLLSCRSACSPRAPPRARRRELGAAVARAWVGGGCDAGCARRRRRGLVRGCRGACGCCGCSCCCCDAARPSSTPFRADVVGTGAILDVRASRPRPSSKRLCAGLEKNLERAAPRLESKLEAIASVAEKRGLSSFLPSISAQAGVCSGQSIFDAPPPVGTLRPPWDDDALVIAIMRATHNHMATRHSGRRSLLPLFCRSRRLPRCSLPPVAPLRTSGKTSPRA